jgi:YD repeat-containing protein
MKTKTHWIGLFGIAGFGWLAACAFATHYAYDEAGRLLQADYGGGQTIDYTYDANGNLLVRSATAGAGPYMLVYSAMAGGTLLGNATQLVAHGASGTAVTAVTNLHFEFTQWSDGIGTAARTDANVTANQSVAAQFAAILAAGGTPHWWLARHYPGNNDFDAVEASHTDGDPFTAGQEYVADTSPTNGSDFLALFDANSPLQGNAIHFLSSTGRLYTLQGNPAVSTPYWTNLPGRGPRAGVGGPDAMPPLPDSPAQLYRLKVGLP